MFCVGDRIVHPMHGAGIVDSIEERKIEGVTRYYYSMKLPASGMVVMIPTTSSAEIGVRPVMDAASALHILNALSSMEVGDDLNWNQRYRQNMLRLKSGDLLEVARVLKCLVLRDKDRGLSTGERKMLHSARQMFVSELVLSDCLSQEEVEARINTALDE